MGAAKARLKRAARHLARVPCVRRMATTRCEKPHCGACGEPFINRTTWCDLTSCGGGDEGGRRRDRRGAAARARGDCGGAGAPSPRASAAAQPPARPARAPPARACAAAQSRCATSHWKRREREGRQRERGAGGRRRRGGALAWSETDSAGVHSCVTPGITPEQRPGSSGLQFRPKHNKALSLSISSK